MKEKTVYIELLRIMAAFAVILIHVVAILITHYSIGSSDWIVCAVLGSLSRWSIPLFFMISGCVFLNRDKQIALKVILKKYISKMLVVLTIWSGFFYFFELWIYSQPISLKSFLLAPINILAGRTGYHLWYLYAIIPIYLLMPALKVFVDGATREQQKNTLLMVMLLCGGLNLFNSVTERIPQLRGIISIGVTLPEICGYVGCVLAGYFLAHFELDMTEKKVLTTTAVVSLICMPIASIALSLLNNAYDTTLSAYTGICSISVAGWIFFSLKHKANCLQNSKWKYVVLNFGGTTFGIYLVHVIFVSIIFHKLPIAWGKMNALLVIFICTFFVFGASYTISYLLGKTPLIRKIT